MANLWLPGYVPGTLQRPAAEKINELETRNQDLTYSGYGEAIPAIYGESLVSGPVLAGPEATSSAFVYAVAISSVGDLPIEGFIGILVNGKREDPPPVITTNPSVFSRGGVSIRLYDGTQTAPDATLKTVFGSQYKDVFPGIAYAVISIPSSQSASLDPANAVKFIVRGRKCFDPRTGQVAWTENPTLHLADYLMSGLHHDPINVIGVEACANWNDSLYSGLPRARTGLVINEELSINDALDLLSTYAECLWSFDGEQVRIIPDAPITGDPPRIDAGSIRAGTLTFRSVNLNQIPTAVSVFFSDREKPEWGSLPGHAQTAGHEVHGTLSSKSDVQMPPVYRLVEADRRAWQRMMRLQTPGRISWQMNDDGILYQAGDVLRLPNIKGLHNLDVRLMSQPELIAPGIYQMHAEIYSAEHYPESGEGIVLPEGVVFLYDGTTTLPLGYEFINTGGELLPIRGGASTGIAAHSGQIPTGSLSASLSTEPNHNGTGRLNTPAINSFNSSGDLERTPAGVNMGAVDAGSHSHSATLSLGSFATSNGVNKQAFKILRKVQITNTFFPIGAIVFADKPLLKEGFTLEPRGAGKFLCAADAVMSTAASTSAAAVSTASGGHTHKHAGDVGYLSRGDTTISFTGAAHSGNHTHYVSGSTQQTLRSKYLLAYRVTDEKALAPEGVIVGFSAGTLPEGWVLCDGQNGTPDLRDFFIALTSDSAQATKMHQTTNRVSVTFPMGYTSTDGSHNHKNGSYFSRKARLSPDIRSLHGDNAGGHRHNTSGGGTRTFDYVPRHFSMRFIKYVGI